MAPRGDLKKPKRKVDFNNQLMIFMQNLFTDEVRDNLIALCKSRILKDYNYKVETFQKEGNLVVKLTMSEQGSDKEILNVQNIITPRGFQELTNQRGWYTWTIDFVDLLKKAMIRNASRPKKKTFWQRLFI